nr:helix-turn-helix domain-containing protein [Rathayibacter sp. VKM Ac-2630]
MPSRRRSATSAPGELLLLLSDGDARTRADVVAETGLPRAAVSAQLDLLAATGLVVRRDDAPPRAAAPPPASPSIRAPAACSRSTSAPRTPRSP